MAAKRLYANAAGELEIDYDDDPELYSLGAYGYGRWPNGGEPHWWVHVPVRGIGWGKICAHKVIEHDDGTITVSPSLLVTGTHSWHGYLERGEWREC